MRITFKHFPAKKEPYRIPEHWDAEKPEAGNCRFSNAISVEMARNYNGSGPTAFGGAESWPKVKLEVGFCVDEDAKAQAFAAELRKFIVGYFKDKK